MKSKQEHSPAKEDKIGRCSSQLSQDRDMVQPIKARSGCVPDNELKRGTWSSQ